MTPPFSLQEGPDDQIQGAQGNEAQKNEAGCLKLKGKGPEP